MILSYKTLESISKEKFLGAFSNSTTAIYLDMLLKMSSVRKELGKILLTQGGFAVDLAVGYVTRTHNDLDLTVLESDIPLFRELFTRAHFNVTAHKNMHPDLYFIARTLITDTGTDIHIDVAGINISGEEVSDNEVPRGEKYIFPIKASELIWERRIGDVPIQFYSPFLVYAFKKVQQKRDIKRGRENQDFQILEKTFPQLNDLS